jgi:hypothetical protein
MRSPIFVFMAVTSLTLLCGTFAVFPVETLILLCRIAIILVSTVVVLIFAVGAALTIYFFAKLFFPNL